jgi:hypothetical protein
MLPLPGQNPMLFDGDDGNLISLSARPEKRVSLWARKLDGAPWDFLPPPRKI